MAYKVNFYMADNVGQANLMLGGVHGPAKEVYERVRVRSGGAVTGGRRKTVWSLATRANAAAGAGS